MHREQLFARVLLRFGPLEITDTLLVSIALSVGLVAAAAALGRSVRARSSLIVIYGALERSIGNLVQIDPRPLLPLVLTQWLFIGLANLIGLVPGVGSPTRDLSVTTALALVAFFAGHCFAFRQRGFGYLRGYAQPHWLLLPFNVIGELSRTLALSLRLFGNVLSGQLIGAIAVYLVGLLVPIPLLLLSVLTSIVQAYIFGVLTLVFAASSSQSAAVTRRHPNQEPPS